MKKNYLTLLLLLIGLSISAQGTLEYRKGGLLYWKMDGPFMSSHNSGNSILIGSNAGLSSNFSFSLKNIFIGQSSGTNLNSGNNNIGIGFHSFMNANGSRNVAVGNHTLTMGSPLFNVAIGDSAAYSNTQFRNVIIGNAAGKNNATGANNVMIGFEAGKNAGASDADNNVFIGHQAGYHETGDHRLYIDNSDTTDPLVYGDFALDEIKINGELRIKEEYAFPLFDGSSDQIMKTDGSGQLSWINLSSIGVNKINDLTDGKTSSSNVYLGTLAGNLDNGNYKNTGVGKESLRMNVAGTNNVAIGHEAMETLNNGDNNTAMGFRALWGESSTSHNVAIGQASLSASGLGNYNTGVGTRAGQNNTGMNNTFIGALAGNSNTGDGNIMIGAYSGQNESGSNKLYIDNSATTDPLIYGDFLTDEVKINGSLDIDGDYILPETPGSTGNIILNAGPGNTATWSPYYMPTSSGSVGQVLKLGASGFVNWSDEEINDADADPTNEYNSNMSLVTNNLTISDGGGNHSVSLAQYENLWSETGSTVYFTGGDVGIGTSSPEGDFHVQSPSLAAEVYITPNAVSNGTSTLFLAEDSDADLGMYWLYSGSDDRLELRGKVNAIEYGPHLTIDRATGDMSVGSALKKSGYKLSVDGKMVCEEVLVELSGDWPDYVFKDEYNLMGIEEVANFINEKGHLPGIEPASVLENEGVELGDMQRRMMEKIEELTLYIIELDKKNKKMAIEIETLKSNK